MNERFRQRPLMPELDNGGDHQPTLQETINIKLIEIGEEEQLKELLREMLVECGWIDEIRGLCNSLTGHL